MQKKFFRSFEQVQCKGLKEIDWVLALNQMVPTGECLDPNNQSA
jgi:hypothetical protein